MYTSTDHGQNKSQYFECMLMSSMRTDHLYSRSMMAVTPQTALVTLAPDPCLASDAIPAAPDSAKRQTESMYSVNTRAEKGLSLFRRQQYTMQSAKIEQRNPASGRVNATASKRVVGDTFESDDICQGEEPSRPSLRGDSRRFCVCLASA